MKQRQLSHLNLNKMKEKNLKILDKLHKDKQESEQQKQEIEEQLRDSKISEKVKTKLKEQQKEVEKNLIGLDEEINGLEEDLIEGEESNLTNFDDGEIERLRNKKHELEIEKGKILTSPITKIFHPRSTKFYEFYAPLSKNTKPPTKRIAKIDEEMDKIDRQIMEKERQIKEEKTREKQEREKENKLIDKSDKQRKTKKINGVEWFLEKEKGEKKPKTGFFGGIKKKFISIEKPSRDVTNHLKKENFEKMILNIAIWKELIEKF